MSRVGNSPKFGATEKCVVCTKSVFALERFVFNEAILHKACFRCSECKRLLTNSNCAALNGVYYCTPHYNRMLQASGSSFAPPGFTRGESTLHDSKLVNSSNSSPKPASSIRTSPAPVSTSAGSSVGSAPTTPKAASTGTPVAAAAAAASAAEKKTPQQTEKPAAEKAKSAPVVESVQDLDDEPTVERIQDTTFIVEALDEDDIAGKPKQEQVVMIQSNDGDEEVVEAAMTEVVNMYAGDDEEQQAESRSQSPSRSSNYDDSEENSDANDSDVEPGGRHPPPDVSDSGLVPAMDAESIASVLRSVAASDIVQSPSERFTIGYAETQGVRRTMEDRMTVYGRYMGCFPENDHQILTADGFLSLAEVERRGADLLVASYDAKRDALVYERPQRLVVNEALGDATELVEFAHADGSSLVTTPNHQMFVRGRNVAASHYRKVAASELLGDSALSMLSSARAGVYSTTSSNSTAMDIDSNEFVRVLNSRTQPQERAALLELYGMWLVSTARGVDLADSAKIAAERERVGGVLARELPTLHNSAAWRSLDAADLRIVVRGARLLGADGDVFTGVTCAELRDELVELLMCAGFAVRFEPSGSEQSWSIAYSSSCTEQRVVRVARVSSDAYARARTWCFTMPSGFVVVRRVLASSVCDKSGRVVVVRASQPTIQGNCTDADYFGMFDGHGGDETAHHVGETLHITIFEHIKALVKSGSEDARLNLALALDDPPTLKQALLNACEALQKGLETRTPPLQGGAVSVVALVIGEQLIVANTGDARCVLVNSDGSSVRLSVDHKPHLPDEKARIEKEGGFVTVHTSRDGVVTSRVCGAIAVSRAFGDVGLQPFLVATPHISELTSISDRAALILACDGLWDVLSDQEAAAVVLAAPNPEKAARRLRNKAYSGGSTDNISCLVIKFR